MDDARHPSFGTALMAALAGSVVSTWASAAAAGYAPDTSVEAWAILTSIFGALGVKLALRVLRYNCPFAFAAGALLAGHVGSLALVQAMPDLDGRVFAGFPGLVVAAFVVQISAAPRRAPTY
jgi:hypothetical protein